MIYLITGVPGSGKTLYAVSTLVKKLLAEKIEAPDGTVIKRRLLVDGIPELLLEHEVLPQLIENKEDKEKGRITFTCDGDGVLTWPSWCKPGDLIVIDEVQRYWRPRAMGVKPPEMIAALETHRHLGIDFIIISQSPMLIDQNVRRLVGRHQHVRRLFGMARAIIYDWDACSMDVHRTKTATTTTWGYPKSAYKLYKSSALHLKQRQKIPIWLLVPVVAVLGLAVVSPTAFGVMRGAMTGKGIAQNAAPVLPASAPRIAASAAAPSTPAPGSINLPPGTPGAPGQVVTASGGVVMEKEKVVFSGCILSAKQECQCFNSKGKAVDVDDDVCTSVDGSRPVVQFADFGYVDPRDPVASAEDGSVLAFMRSKRSH